MKKIIVHNPCNEYTRYYRNYNYFWDLFTEYLKFFFDVTENRYYENANSSRYKINLKKGLSDNLLMLECEYIIENDDTGEFVIMSISDDLTHTILNEQNNTFLKKVLVSQFSPNKIKNHVQNNFEKYSPWTYFQSGIENLDVYYMKRKYINPTNNKIYFKGTSLEDREILFKIEKDLITSFNTINPDSYFNDIINYKIALSVDGRGEFCYRDIECFAIGVPIIRFEYESKFYEDLIPNFHYISIPRPSDMTLYRLGTHEHAKQIENRYHEVINDSDFLNFISNNARKYYEKNCKLDNVVKNTYKILELDNWL